MPLKINPIFTTENMTIQVKESYIEAIRKRPAMYLGAVDGRGIASLLNELLSIFLQLGAKGALQIKLIVLEKDEFSLEISSGGDLVPELKALEKFEPLYNPLFLSVLRAVARRLDVQYCARAYSFSPTCEIEPWKPSVDRGKGWMKLDFQLDDTILRSDNFDPDLFSERMRILAMLHPQVELVFQNGILAMPHHFHFPDGLVHLYREAKAGATMPALCDLSFQGRWAGNGYQIAFGLLTMPQPVASIRSFANTLETISHGSLTDGIVVGIKKAIQAKLQQLKSQTNHASQEMKAANISLRASEQLNWARMRRSLILVAAIEGDHLEFHHPTRDKLHSLAAARAGREIAYHLVMEEFERNPAFLPALMQSLTQIRV